MAEKFLDADAAIDSLLMELSRLKSAADAIGDARASATESVESAQRIVESVDILIEDSRRSVVASEAAVASSELQIGRSIGALLAASEALQKTLQLEIQAIEALAKSVERQRGDLFEAVAAASSGGTKTLSESIGPLLQQQAVEIRDVAAMVGTVGENQTSQVKNLQLSLESLSRQQSRIGRHSRFLLATLLLLSLLAFGVYGFTVWPAIVAGIENFTPGASATTPLIVAPSATPAETRAPAALATVPQPTLVATLNPTSAPTPLSTPEPTDTPDSTETPASTDTRQPTDTPIPTGTPVPSVPTEIQPSSSLGSSSTPEIESPSVTSPARNTPFVGETATPLSTPTLGAQRE